MLRRTCTKLTVNPFGLFLVKTKGLPELQGLTFLKRSKKVTSLFRGLSKADKAKLVAQASRVPAFPPRVRKARKAHKYALFVKANSNKFSGSASERIKKIAVLWNEQKAAAFSI